MYMSNIVFNPAALTHAGIYEAHRGLWKIFSDDPDRERDFLYRDMGQSSEAGPAFLAVSARPPGNRNLLAHCQIKSYAPRLSAGERLLFSLRVNPVRKTKEGKK